MTDLVRLQRYLQGLRTIGFKNTLLSLGLLGCGFLFGCTSLFSSATANMADNLAQAVLDNDDLATVEMGAPAHMLMIDGLIHGDPSNESLLRAGAALYTAYTMAFVEEKARAQKLIAKARAYGQRAVCVRRATACELQRMLFQDFQIAIAAMTIEDVPALFALGSAWSGWIQVNQDDLQAVAELSRVEAIMQRLVELNEDYRNGEAYIYLGVFATLVPPSLGGKPDVGRQYFERAIQLSEGKNLMAQVFYARHYARMMFDRKLHDRLLKEVIASDPKFPGYTLTNMLAQKQAAELLESADEFF